MGKSCAISTHFSTDASSESYNSRLESHATGSPKKKGLAPLFHSQFSAPLLTLFDRLDAETDAALLVDLQNLDLDDVTLGELVAHVLDALLGDL
jgi:hypothetical protein